MTDTRGLGHLLGCARRNWGARLEAALSRYGVRIGHYFILDSLWTENGQTASQLAQYCGIRKPTVTRAVHDLELAGLVTLQSDPSDRRLVRVYLTAQGQQLGEAIPKILNEVNEEALDGFSAGERSQLLHFLERIHENVVGDRCGRTIRLRSPYPHENPA